MNPNMSPVEWAKLPLMKYADCSGRSPRPELWWFVLAIVIAYVVAMIVEGIVGLKGMIAGVYGPLTMLLWLVTIVPSISVGVRRLHDTDRSGYWILVWIVPACLSVAVRIMYAGAGVFAMLGMMSLIGFVSLVGAVVLIVFYCLPGTPGDNRYGPNPYGGTGTVPAE